ncbi:hypothetical protein Pmani_031847 [Petrolisthes manimaculis]|uniref:Uncharacterized protein n=1 Tax=Petrolisthes manimaculis TaxID=1843537 RepID=A0AAE1NUB5_9EUCA|nr:hypothetical protein Pmani_031847 [Petrolisthes manimaculis]
MGGGRGAEESVGEQRGNAWRCWDSGVEEEENRWKMKEAVEVEEEELNSKVKPECGWVKLRKGCRVGQDVGKAVNRVWTGKLETNAFFLLTPLFVSPGFPLSVQSAVSDLRPCFQPGCCQTSPLNSPQPTPIPPLLTYLTLPYLTPIPLLTYLTPQHHYY